MCQAEETQLLETTEQEASTEEPSTLDKLRGKLWIARKYPDHFLPDEMPEFLRRWVTPTLTQSDAGSD